MISTDLSSEASAPAAANTRFHSARPGFSQGRVKNCVPQKFGGLILKKKIGGLAQTYLELGQPICRGVVVWAP